MLACKSCNNIKSKNDDYLRDFFVLNDDSYRHPSAQSLIPRVLRSVTYNSSLLGRTLLENGRYGPRYTRNGIYLSHYTAAPLDTPRLEDALKTIIRGLYYKTREQRLPDNCLFKMLHFDPASIGRAFTLQFLDDLNENGVVYNGPYTWGEDVFSCIFIFLEDQPATSYWLIWFFDGFFVLISTKPSMDPPK